MKPLRALAALLCVCAAIGAPSGSPSAAPLTGDPYEIDVIIPITGSAAFLGKSYAETYRALEIAVNASGGIKARPVKFVLEDSQTSPQIGLQLAQGLIAKHVPAFIDGGPSTVCNASVPIVVQTGPVDYCLSPVIHPPAGSYVFSASVSSVDQARIAVRYFRERGWTRVAMISSTDITGEDLDHQTETALQLPENKTLQLVAREHFNTTDLSVAAQLARIKAADPQALLVWTTGTPLGTVLRGVSEAGLALPLQTTNSNMTYAQMNAYAEFLPRDLYFPALLAMTPQTGGRGALRDAQAAYVDAFKAIGVRPDEGHVLAWDPTMIVISALRTLGPAATATQIRDYILHLRGWTGVDGTYDFSSGNQRGIGEDAAAVARWDAAKKTWTRVSRPGGYL
jgi:branched-chain amino acid transport system substrate-binding protein